MTAPAWSQSIASDLQALSRPLPDYLYSAYSTALAAPLPATPANAPPSNQIIPQFETDADPFGTIGQWQPAGPTTTSTNAFFQSLGTNGRSCATCHTASDGMSVSAAHVQNRYNQSFGADPIFAPVDGSNCPSNLSFLSQSHSLLLNKGLFRIALPVPLNAQYTLRVLSDPYGCETDPRYSVSIDPNGVKRQVVSVYRRPLPATNLTFALAVVTTGPFGVPPGTPSGNIMFDGREPTLQSQAIDATLIHAQATRPPTTAQVAQMVAFENGLFTAQVTDQKAGSLTASGINGGPKYLAAQPTGIIANPSLDFFDAWSTLGQGHNQTQSQQASIYRGQQIFNGATVTFSIGNVAGFNDAIGLNPLPGSSCSTCHNQQAAGNDALIASQRDIGIAGDSANFGGPQSTPDMPLFSLTCPAGTTAYNGTTANGVTTVKTSDPGVALISGKCTDIGKFTTPVLRGLASRAPYFSDGSAKDLPSLVNVYNKRFSIGLTSAQQQDLVNFLKAL